MSNAVQTREFEIDKNIAIFHIHSQAGSPEKAFSEAVMNAVDARATVVRIRIDENGVDYVISDNGRGFADEKEITNCFGKLGFDHSTQEEQEKGRVYGAFGLGRAQLWGWSRNTWKSGPFRMFVDIQELGMAYDLLTNKEPVEGCTIEGEFYEPISLNQIVNLRRSLKQLTEYMDISIYFNDELISKPIENQNWHRKTEDAYFKFNESGGLKVYNQGMFVKEFPVSSYGISGVVISRKTMTLNVARNDIMLNRCSVFPEIIKVLKEESRKRADKPSTALSQNDRIAMLRQLLTDPQADISLHSKYVVKAVNGRFYSINQICKSFGKNVCVGEHDYSPIGEAIIHQGSALVISPSYLQTLDFSIDDFVTALSSFQETTLNMLDYTALAKEMDSPVQVLKKSDLTRKQKVILKTLERINNKVSMAVSQFYKDDYFVSKSRSVYLGKLRTSIAWTDGRHSIGYNPDELQRSLDFGLKGFFNVAQVLLHEYCHQQSSTSDHSHDLEFFKHYHDASDRLAFLMEDFREITILHSKDLVKAGLAIPKQIARGLPEKAESRIIAELEKRDLLAE